MADSNLLQRQAIQAHRNGQSDEALNLLEQAIAADPANPAIYINASIILQDLGRYGEAIDKCRRAIAIKPDFAAAHAALGAVLCSAGEPEEAVTTLRHALELQPGDLTARYIFAESLFRTGQFAQSEAQYQAVLAAAPDHARAHFGLGVLRLLLGDFERGWKGYQWRWQTGDPSIIRRTFTSPQWDGSDLSGKTILLFCEQGHGDSIQFVRYASLLAERGARVILESPLALSTLLSGVKGIDRLVEAGQTLPPHDFHCSLMTLPKLFRTALETIPASVRYLAAPPPLKDKWRRKFEERERCDAVQSLRVGLAWAGNARYYRDCDRSLRSTGFDPLTVSGNIHFVSLQKSPAAAGRPPLSAQTFSDWTDELTNWADTAALIENLDLVISSDTAVAHLAGALGKPVWLLTSFVPDWRWLLHRTDSPWYPTMRLFRQPRAKDWQSVIAEVATSLVKLDTTQRV